MENRNLRQIDDFRNDKRVQAVLQNSVFQQEADHQLSVIKVTQN